MAKIIKVGTRFAENNNDGMQSPEKSGVRVVKRPMKRFREAKDRVL